MLRADAVVDAVEPGLHIGEDEVDHRHELFGHFGVAAFGNCMVVEAPLAQSGIASPIVGDDQRAWHDGTLDKATQGIGAAVSSDGQSHSTGIAAILPLVLCRARLPVANLDSGGHQRFVVDAPAFAARPSTDPRLIDLHMLFRPMTSGSWGRWPVGSIVTSGSLIRNLNAIPVVCVSRRRRARAEPIDPRIAPR